MERAPHHRPTNTDDSVELPVAAKWKSPRLGLIGLFVILLSSILCPTNSRAQNKGVDIVTSYNNAVKAIGAEKYDLAIRNCDAVINRYGGANKGKEQFGPVYGHFFYIRGLAKMGKKQWASASIDFKACYDCTFRTPKILSCKTCYGFGRVMDPNPQFGNRTQDGKIRCQACGGIPVNAVTKPNLFRMHSLVQWGNCQAILENWDEAISLYRRALTEDREKRLNFQWQLYSAVNLGRCLIKSGKVDEGYNYIVRALDEDAFPLPIKQVVFQILADDWSPQVGADQTREFLDKYRHIPLSAPPEERAERNPNIYYLANDALKRKDDPLLALSWLRIISHPGEAIAELNATISLYEARKKPEERPEVIPKIDAEISEMTKARELMETNFWSMQSGIGISHYQLQNFSASYSVYSGLADFAPKKHEGRPEFLHNAVISGVKIDNWIGAYDYGMTFLDEFPKHPLKPPVVRVLVEMIFIRGNYQKAYDIAKEVRVEMESGSEIRDIPDFIVGASAYQLGKFDEAEEELTSYLETYKPAQRDELARYFLGSTKVKKYKWQEGTDIFDPFMKDYPQSAMTSSVLYQNGMCKFMIDDNAAALPLVNRLLKEFPSAEEIPRGWNLLGDIQSVEEADFDTVIGPAYNNGITTSANFPDQAEVAAYAMWQLMMNTSDLERWEDSGKWFDRFQKEHPDSVYAVDMLIGALDTLVALDRTEEAIRRQKDLLFDTAKESYAHGQLAELFGTFLDFIKANDWANVSAHLEELVFKRNSTTALRAWAKIGRIQLLEEVEGENEEAINQIFYQLDSNFDPSLHSNYVIVRLARWHTDVRKKPKDAAPLYDYILENRDGTEDFDLALLDRAQIDAMSELPEDRARAMTYFDRVLDEFGNAELAESASLGRARLLLVDKKYEEALPQWEAYMDNASWNKFSAEANYYYAHCLDQLGRVDEALVVYINTYNAFPGYLDFSTPAYLRSALIMKAKGEDLKALLILKDMLARMEEIEHPNIKKARSLFDKWRAEYVHQPEKGGT